MIVQHPDQGLRQVAERVDSAFVRSPEFKELIKKMYDAMIKANGVGIAAPQIGVNKQIALIHKDFIPTQYEHLHILINPDYSVASNNIITQKEGCLSVEHGLKHEMVRRYSFIDVTLDVFQMDGTLITATERIGGFLARIIQHEVQHLNGILYIDRKLDYDKDGNRKR